MRNRFAAGGVENFDSAEPADGKSNGTAGVATIGSEGRIYFYTEGQKYYITGTLVSAPTGLAGTPIGLLLVLTYSE